MTWVHRVYNTQTGALEFEMPEASSGTWSTRITGRGSASHTFPLFGAGVSRSDIREFTKGNKYTITQEWDGHVAYAGVIQRRRYKRRLHTLEVSSVELRSAYMNDRMLFGVPAYEAAGGAATVLAVTNKSYSGAVRAVLDAATNLNSEWEWPLDLPSDGSGSFSADWKYNQRLKVEDHLAEIEEDGCEVFLRPYLSGSDLRYDVEVGSPVTLGSATTIDIDDPTSPLTDVEVEDDYVKQMTGVLAFGEGGKAALAKYAPTGGTGATDMGVRDTWVSFLDITDESRLQAAADNTYAALRYPTAGWSFGLRVFPDGPAFAAPGRLISLTSSGDEFILDETHALRVVGLRGDLGFTVIPEVQDAS